VASTPGRGPHVLARLAVPVAVGAIFGRRPDRVDEGALPALSTLLVGGLVAVDPSLTVRYAGGSGLPSLLGAAPEELVGRPFREYLEGDAARTLSELVSRAEPGGPPRTAELRLRRRSGDGVAVRVAARRLEGRDGPVVALLLEDLSERDELVRAVAERAAELSRSNRDLEQFAYVASHDLQEPLRMVGSYTQLIQARYEDRLDEDGKEYLRFAHDGVVRMRELIDDLLKFARLGHRAEPFAPVALDAVLAQALTNLDGAIRSRHAEVTHTPLPEVHGDRVQLVQLFQNLIANAIKFHPGPVPHVRVSAVAMSGGWTFTVRDDGIGIPPEAQEKVFLMFQRLHTREEYPGTGIGLPICRRVVERHGGRIWIESSGRPGEGTAFHFTLPSSAGAAVPAGVPSPPSPREAAIARRAEQMIEERLRELI
jgi:two-component system, chemotaxis family, sensor kinase Cph1